MTHDTAHSITRINPPELGEPPGYSQIVEVTAGRNHLHAGQTALDRDGNVVGRNDFAAQAEQVFKTWRSRCGPADARPPNLVKLTVFLTDMDNLARYRDARRPILRLRDARGGARGDAGRGVEAVRSGFPDRDRSRRGCVGFISALCALRAWPRRAYPERGDIAASP